jgi:hypothetical protein
MDSVNSFDPALLSFPDCDFLLAHAGEAPAVALIGLPPQVNRVPITQWISKFYELEELQRVGRGTWVGVEKVKECIKTYLDVRAKWKQDEAKGAPRNPSLYSFDSRGNAHFQAPGSDSGRVRTYFDDKGNRIPFAINLVDSGYGGQWKPEWIRPVKAEAKDEKDGGTDSTEMVKEPADKNAIECGVKGCGHTETYNSASRSSYGAARGRMSKHMRKAKFEPEVHREYHSMEFGS